MILSESDRSRYFMIRTTSRRGFCERARRAKQGASSSSKVFDFVIRHTHVNLPNLFHFFIEQVKDVLSFLLPPVAFHMVIPGAPWNCWDPVWFSQSGVVKNSLSDLGQAKYSFLRSSFHKKQQQHPELLWTYSQKLEVRCWQENDRRVEDKLDTDLKRYFKTKNLTWSTYALLGWTCGCSRPTARVQVGSYSSCQKRSSSPGCLWRCVPHRWSLNEIRRDIKRGFTTAIAGRATWYGNTNGIVGPFVPLRLLETHLALVFPKCRRNQLIGKVCLYDSGRRHYL